MIKRLMEKESMGQDDLNLMKKHTEMVCNKIFGWEKPFPAFWLFPAAPSRNFKSVDLNHLLAETLALTEYQMRLQGIKVETRFAPDLLPIKADSVRRW
jgi:nitrogen fixation/metabolism regulation signal transduction histidine kinase